MVIQYVNSLKNIEYKPSDVIFCHLKDTAEKAENIFNSNLILCLTNISANLNCLIFAYFNLISFNQSPQQPFTPQKVFQTKITTQGTNTQNLKTINTATQPQTTINKNTLKPNFAQNTNSAVAIISNGNLIDIYEENDIEVKFNLSTYQTRLGKVAILIDSDIYSPNIFYALKAISIDLAIAFTQTPIPPEIFAQSNPLPLISITPNSIT